MRSITEKSLRLARRMSRLGTESAFEVLVRARELDAREKNIIHLETGEPDFATPSNVAEAARTALREGWTHYEPSAGLPELREAIAEDHSGRLGVPIDPSEVVVTPGGKPIIFFTTLAFVDEGDEVLYSNPGFPIYESMIQFTGGKPVPYAPHEDLDFDVGTNDILKRITDRTRLVILNSPHNPTGGVISREQIRVLAETLASRGIFVLSDEIFSRLIFEGPHSSILQFPGMKNWTIILNGFSNTYAMTGWRLGYGVMRRDLARQVALLMTYSNSCTASFTQIAGVEALRGNQDCVDRMLEALRRRRGVIVDGPNSIPGFKCRTPHGAFYAFLNIQATGKSSKQIADSLLLEAGVACLAGTAFGAQGEGYLRFSFANSAENIQKALGKIRRWVNSNR